MVLAPCISKTHLRDSSDNLGAVRSSGLAVRFSGLAGTHGCGQRILLPAVVARGELPVELVEDGSQGPRLPFAVDAAGKQPRPLRPID